MRLLGRIPLLYRLHSCQLLATSQKAFACSSVIIPSAYVQGVCQLPGQVVVIGTGILGRQSLRYLCSFCAPFDRTACEYHMRAMPHCCFCKGPPNAGISSSDYTELQDAEYLEQCRKYVFGHPAPCIGATVIARREMTADVLHTLPSRDSAFSMTWCGDP